MKFISITLFLFIYFYSFTAKASIDIPQIKLELAKLEISKDKDFGFKKCEDIILKITEEEKINPNSAEIYTWKGIVTAKMAHYKKSLSLANEARVYLEKAVSINEKASDAAALNALGILYHRVPRFISFGDNKKAEEYFKKAISTSSNLDTNWRYGEFLIDVGKKEEGVKLLKIALTKVNPQKTDEKIKEKIIQDLIKKYE